MTAQTAYTSPGVHKTILIHAPAYRVWEVLTTPSLIKHWMSDYSVEIESDWKEGSPITYRGHLHGMKYENRSVILKMEAEKLLRYTHWSTLSQHADIPEHYSVIEFRLIPKDGQTELILTQTNFATETIYKHTDFYWNATLEILKRVAEEE